MASPARHSLIFLVVLLRIIDFGLEKGSGLGSEIGMKWWKEGLACLERLRVGWRF